VTVEIKRRGAPQSAPPRCEDLCAAAILGGEKEDDLPKDGVREIADAVRPIFYGFLRSRGRGRFCPGCRVQDLQPAAPLAGASSVYIAI
jgi:hypothetical protein